MKKILLIAVLAVAGLSACKREEAGPSDPAVALAAGWENYRLNEFDRAEAMFRAAVAATATNRPLYLQAMYGLATTLNLRRPGEDRKQAAELYTKLLALDPHSDVAPWTALALARMKHLVPVGKNPDYDDVRKAYQEVIDAYPGHLAAKEALVYRMATYIATLKEDDARYAIAGLSNFVAQSKGTEFVSPAWSLMAVGHTTRKQPELRLKAEENALKTYEIDPTNPSAELGWFYWTVATIAEFEVGDFATARTYYRKLLSEYPHDQMVFGAKQALKRMDDLETKLRGEIAREPAGRRP